MQGGTHFDDLSRAGGGEDARPLMTRRHIRDTAITLVELAAFAVLVAGVARVSVTAAMISAGALTLAACFLYERRQS